MNLSIFNSKPPRRRRFPKAFFLAVLLVLASETVVQYFDNILYSDMANGVFAKLKSELAGNPAVQFDILILGDCFNQTGIAPEVLEDLTGLSAFNFSTDGYHTILSAYILLKDYLEVRSQRPRYLFIGFLPKVWSQEKQAVADDYLFALADFKDRQTALFLREFGLLKTAKLFVPTLRHQEYLLRASRKKLFLRFLNKEELEQGIFESMLKRKGSYFPWGDQVQVAPAPDSCRAPEVSAFFKKYLSLILDLARQAGIKVFYLVPSVPESWAAKAAACQESRSLWAFLDVIKERYPDVTILDLQSILREEKIYYNDLHLNTDGVYVLSQYLAQVINESPKDVP